MDSGKLIPSLPHEPQKWYENFLEFVKHGGNLSATFDAVAGQAKAGKGSVSGAWLRMSDKWQWRKRYEAFKTAELEIERAEIQTVFRQEKKKRLSILKRATTKLSRAMAGLPPVIGTWGEFASALRVIVNCSQDELGIDQLETTLSEIVKREGKK